MIKVVTEMLWNVLFMAARIKIDSKFTYVGADFWNVRDQDL